MYLLDILRNSFNKFRLLTILSRILKYDNNLFKPLQNSYTI